MDSFVVINHIVVIARALVATTLRGVCERWGSRPHRHMQAATNKNTVVTIRSTMMIVK